MYLNWVSTCYRATIFVTIHRKPPLLLTKLYSHIFGVKRDFEVGATAISPERVINPSYISLFHSLTNTADAKAIERMSGLASHSWEAPTSVYETSLDITLPNTF